MFLVLWAAVFREKKEKRDGISAFVIMGYGNVFYKKQFGKLVFAMLAFCNLHCLNFLIANSIYMKITGVMMKSFDVMQESYPLLTRAYATGVPLHNGWADSIRLGIILNNLLDNALEACEKLEPGKGK